MRPPSRCCALLAVALLLAGCGRSEGRPRAVVIGIDGADWKVIEPLLAAGRMPRLQALRERGVWGPIRTLAQFPLSPVIWTSVATGKGPAKVAGVRLGDRRRSVDPRDLGGAGVFVNSSGVLGTTPSSARYKRSAAAPAI